MNLFHNSHTEYISNIRFQMLDIMELGELPGIKEIDTIRDQAGGLTSSMRTPKFFFKQRSNNFVPLHYECFAYYLFVYRQFDLYCGYRFSHC